MKRALAVALACGSVLSDGCIIHTRPGGGPQAPAGASVITLAPAERHQVLEGFGASVAWHIDRIVGSPPRGIYPVLFPELGLDILRLRNRYRRTEAGDGNMQQEVEVMRRAAEALGYRPKILLSSWSPPASLKANGAERCKSNKNCTLKKENGKFVYQQFADYWYESIQHYGSLGLAPDYVSIQNEPDFIPPDWEGCKFEPTESGDYPAYHRALEAVSARLSHSNARPRLLGPEVLGIHEQRAEKYLGSLDGNLLYGVAHHLYEKGDDGIWDWKNPGPDSYRVPLRGVALAAQGKPIFQTEFGTQDDHGTEGGFEIAWLIHNSLVEEGAVAFLYWDLVWQPPSGLVSVGGARYKIRDQYYALRHYARFTDPGWVRIGARSDVDGVKVSAFLGPAADRLTAVVLNVGTQPMNVRLDPGGFSAASSATYRTRFVPGKSEVWQELGPLPPSGIVYLPPRAVMTVVLSSQA